jgi:RNA polymerase sigma factor (sigma-70 family)
MSETEWNALRDALVNGYEDLARRLTRRLHSSELAREALQDTYLRLHRGGEIGQVDHPQRYVLRIATNLARDRQRSEQRRSVTSDLDGALAIPDDAPDPAHVAEAKSDLAALERAMATLPARRRAIFLAAWKENLPPGAIAQRYGIGKRRVHTELELARQHCAEALKNNFEE